MADPVDTTFLPSGVLALPVSLNGKLAYVFKDEDGTDVTHFVGEFLVTMDHGDGLQLRSDEAIVWVNHRVQNGTPYRHIQILLWRDAEIREAGGTLTTGPALFVTINTTGKIFASMDDVTLRSSASAKIYQEGNAIRKEVATSRPISAAGNAPFRVFDASGLRKKAEAEKPRPIINLTSNGELLATETTDGRRIITITGGVYLARGTPGTDDFLDLRADSVVVFLPAEQAATEDGETIAAGLGTDVGRTIRSDDGSNKPRTRGKTGRAVDKQIMSTGIVNPEVESAYLEGDVVMSQGPNTVRASKIYYDFLHDRATILDAVIHTTLAERGIPLYVRADEIRQLSRSNYVATDAMITTSEFHTPHYHVGASRIELSNLAGEQQAVGGGGVRMGSFRIRHATLNVSGVPIAYLPFIQGSVNSSETAIRGLRTGFSNEFGLELQTDWELFNALGYETPEGVDATLSLDEFTERGPALGVDATYRRDRYFGTLRSYLLTDNSEDFLGREREQQSRKDIRGRFLLRHRQYLEDDWQVSLEISYISDEGFLEEFFEPEFDREKEQETILYLKKQRENWAFTASLQSRPLDFTTQTERMPDLAYFLVGEPISDRVTLYSENRLGVVRLRTADQSFRELFRNGRTHGSGSVARLDTRQEFTTPVNVGPMQFVPFLAVRGTTWDDSRDSGGITRILATYGVRGSMYLSHVYDDVESSMFDLHGVRHIVKPDIVAWVSHTNVDGSELFAFDESVEEIDEVDGISVGVRQRWQTKRGPQGRRRTVDFLTLDTEAGAFRDNSGRRATNGFTSYSRPENGSARNYVNSSLIWRVNDRTALLSEFNYDTNDGEIDIANVALSVERSPRFSYVLGYRLIEESNSDLFGFDMNYRLTEKHTLAVRELYDSSRGETLDLTVALIRKFPRWFGAISFALDEAEDDFGVSLSIWPEGLPQAALGSTRFSGVSDISRLRGR